MQNLLHQISTRVHLSSELKDEITSKFDRVITQKNEIILKEGQRARHIYFVEKGLLHNYYFHDDRQITSWFYAQNSFVTAWNSFYNQNASYEEIKCLEECVLYRINYDNYQTLISEYPTFNTFARILAEEMLSFIDEFSKGWSFSSAQEKYALLLQYFPDIELRVKLGLISSFLGISQETLSRIRAKS